MSISMRPGSAASLPDSTASTGLPCLLVGACEHSRSSTTEDHMATTTQIPNLVRDNIWHSWVGANWRHAARTVGEGPPQLWPESSSVDCENLRERQYTLIPEGFLPRSLCACRGWCGMCDDISRRKGWIGIITSSHCTLFLDRVGYLYISCHVQYLF